MDPIFNIDSSNESKLPAMAVKQNDELSQQDTLDRIMRDEYRIELGKGHLYDTN